MRSFSARIICAAVLLTSALASAQSPTSVPPPAPKPEATAAPEVPQSGAASAPQLTRADVEAWLDGFMPFTLRSGDIAGAVVVVVKDGEILAQKGYGYSDVEKRTPVDPERTLFRPGSVSKLFTWTAVMQQVEQGKLDLDADVNKYLDFKIPDRDGKPITMRNIMTHTPGFEEAYRRLIIDADGSPVMSLDEYVKESMPARIYAPGNTPAYSNYATTVAGYIVTRLSGMSFDDYLDKFVFAPLDMKRATFRQPLPEALRADMSLGYPRASEKSKPYEIIPAAPAGSLAASGTDMAHFMIGHLQQGRYGENRILNADTAKLMHDSALTVLPRVHRMLLGFYETNRNGHRVISHGGDTQWFHSDLNLFIDDGVGLFISMNSAGKEGASGNIRSALFEDFADRYFPGDAPQSEVDAKTAAEHARMISGGYDISRRMETNFFSVLNLMGQIKVAVNEDGTITVPLMTNPAGVPLKWREIEPFLWREVGGKQLLSATVDQGRVTRFSFEPLSAIMVFEPTPGYRSGLWLGPLCIVALSALLLTTLAWPIAALTRRHYRVAYALSGQDARARRWVLIAALAAVTLSAAWLITVTMALQKLSLLDGGLDWWYWLLQIASLFVYIGAAAVGLWNAWTVLRSRRSWYAKTWAVILAISFVALLWVALAYDLIAFDLRY
jgi:CubicO group peptidase (beta-lactamase class C family)